MSHATRAYEKLIKQHNVIARGLSLEFLSEPKDVGAQRDARWTLNNYDKSFSFRCDNAAHTKQKKFHICSRVWVAVYLALCVVLSAGTSDSVRNILLPH